MLSTLKRKEEGGAERGVNTFKTLYLVIVISGRYADFVKSPVLLGPAGYGAEGWILMADGYQKA